MIFLKKYSFVKSIFQRRNGFMGSLKETITKEILKHPKLIDEIKDVFNQDVPYDHDFSTFTTTEIPGELKQFIMNWAEMNIAISPKAFPSIKRMEKECIDFIAKMFHAEQDYLGVATIGSSEACIIAGISMLLNWKKKNKSISKTSNEKPNLIISEAYQICWKRFADMFDVELRLIKTQNNDCTIMVGELEKHVDHNTIGIVALFANTLTGCYDNIFEINSIVEKIKKEKQLFIPIHIDAASGGFYAPFVTPNLIFDFRLKNITSISVSGHKFGLVPPSIGWLFFRNAEAFNSPLKNELDYLGGGLLKDVGINFSKSGMPLIAQYFLIKTLGFKGYKKIIMSIDKMSKYLENELRKISDLTIISKGDISTIIYKVEGVDMYELENLLRDKFRWQVPTYKLPNSSTICQRLVVRSDMTKALSKQFISDLKNSINVLKNNK